jgi:lipoprotein-releasing system permease protein
LRSRKISAVSSGRRFVSFIVWISVAGVALGTATLIVALSILAGFEKTLTDNIVGYTAHAEVRSYHARGIPDYGSTGNYLKKNIPEIRSLSPFVQQDIILRSSKGITGLVLKGVKPDDSLSVGLRKVVKGKTLLSAASDTLPPIIVSSGVARELGLDIGKAVTAFRFHEGMKSREDILAGLKRFRIVGIYETGMTEYDNTIAYTTLAAGQEFTGYTPKQVTGFLVLANDISESRAVTEKINNTLRYPYFATSVYEIYQTIFAWIELQRKPIPIILGLIIIVAAFNVISTLLIMVIEKTRSVGVLKTLGATNGGIAQIFLGEGLSISTMGVLCGNVLGFVICFLQREFHFFKLKSEIYFMSSVPISIEWQHYVIVSLIAIVISVAATLIPARIASRILPLKALKFG